MTLIIGIKCKDGIVLGADGAATYALPFNQQHTIRQRTIKKLTIIGENLVVGVSGPVGLGQTYCQEFSQYLTSKNGRTPFKTALEARKYFQESMWKHAEPLWKKAEVVAKTTGPQAAMSDCNHSSVAAFPIGEQPCLMQFTSQCAPEEASDHLPFLSIGSGQSTADPFLAFIRRLFWEKELPSVGEGIFTVNWTLKYAINADTGITEPIQIVTLKKGSGNLWKAEELSADELGEHNQMIAEMEKTMRNGILEKFASQHIDIPRSPVAS